MAAIHSKDTKPELRVRSMMHKAGFRYILHDRRLVGRPDLVFPKYHVIVFIHGCFWHGHKKCLRSKSNRLPKTNIDYWSKKIEGNIKRDAKHQKNLRKQGWRVFRIWECDVSEKTVQSLIKKIRSVQFSQNLFINGTLSYGIKPSIK